MDLRTGVILPGIYERHASSESSPPLIIGHGLGASNPKSKSHTNDEWIKVLFTPATQSNKSYITYTARGHGGSTGWQDTAESNPEQFT